jgi:hypothetical protein
MNRKVYFGNATKQAWIPAPQTGLAAATTGFMAQNQLLNGRNHVKRSKASHRSFQPTWIGSMNADAIEDSLHTIKDFSDGLYGDGPFYWLDPYAVATNVLAPHWAAPMLSGADWPSICSIGTKTKIATPANTRNYPSETLQIAMGASVQESTAKLTIIIPIDHKLHFGWHGTRASGTAGFVLRCYSREDGTATDVMTDPIDVNSDTRTNTQVRGDLYSRVEILIENPTASASTITASGLIVQVLDELASVDRGGFISGRGTTALEFTELPQFEYYSAAVNNGQVGLSAALAEV